MTRINRWGRSAFEIVGRCVFLQGVVFLLWPFSLSFLKMLWKRFCYIIRRTRNLVVCWRGGKERIFVGGGKLFVGFFLLPLSFLEEVSTKRDAISYYTAGNVVIWNGFYSVFNEIQCFSFGEGLDGGCGWCGRNKKISCILYRDNEEEEESLERHDDGIIQHGRYRPGALWLHPGSAEVARGSWPFSPARQMSKYDRWSRKKNNGLLYSAIKNNHTTTTTTYYRWDPNEI